MNITPLLLPHDRLFNNLQLTTDGHNNLLPITELGQGMSGLPTCWEKHSDIYVLFVSPLRPPPPPSSSACLPMINGGL